MGSSLPSLSISISLSFALSLSLSPYLSPSLSRSRSLRACDCGSGLACHSLFLSWPWRQSHRHFQKETVSRAQWVPLACAVLCLDSFYLPDFCVVFMRPKLLEFAGFFFCVLGASNTGISLTTFAFQAAKDVGISRIFVLAALQNAEIFRL